MRFARSFGAFWYDFLIGDRPELFVGALAALALAWVAIEVGVDPAIAGGLLTILLLGLGWASLALATRRSR